MAGYLPAEYQPSTPRRSGRRTLWAGRLQGQQPAGTYARKVLEPLLIDLSWASSYLEGNRYTRLDTEALFRLDRGGAVDHDAVMLLNHKAAIEILVDNVPTQIPSLLAEMFGEIVDKARQIKNPIEAAFFMWCHLAYLQAFDDGNKCVSRLAANIPLMLYNCAPLSFMDVSREAYTLAMLGIYEQTDCSRPSICLRPPTGARSGSTPR